MSFSQKNLTALLTPYRTRSMIPDTDEKKYRWVSLLPEEPDMLSEDVLYVCWLSEVLKNRPVRRSIRFLCLSDRILDEKDLPENLILVEENHSLSWLLNLVQDRFRELEHWKAEMDHCILTGGDYQELIRISENYLRNPLFVLDSSYRLIASGTRYRSHDPIHKELYEKGVFSKEVFARFSANERLDEYYHQSGITVSEKGRIGEFQSFGQWCRFEDAAPIQVVEVFEANPPVADSEELFSFMMHYFELCFEAEQKKNVTSDNAASRILREMLHGSLSESSRQKTASEMLGVPFFGCFQVFAIRFNQIERVIVGRFLRDIGSLFSEVHSVMDNQIIFCLIHQSSQRIARPDRAYYGRLNKLLSDYDAACGVSASYDHFDGFKAAAEQAEYALCHTSGSAITLYSDVFVYRILETAACQDPELFGPDPFTDKWILLEDYDRENHSMLSRILFTYLVNERRASAAAELLHMHRNTVMYHVARIEDLTGVDLNDWQNRLGLLMAWFHRSGLRNE